MVLSLLLLAPALAGSPTHDQFAGASWAPVTTKSHGDLGTIEVFSATIAGVDCFRGTASTPVPPDKLMDVVIDVEGAKRWSSAGVTEAALLARTGSRIEYYQYLDVPGWTMASDRFWFLYSDLDTEGDEMSLKWQRLEDGGAHAAKYQSVKSEHPDAIEPPVNVGAWTFVREGETTKMTYEVCTDSGGSIPAMVQSAATKKTLPDTLADVVVEAKKR